MPDNYTVLLGKYQRALVSIRELEQERDSFKKKTELLESEHTKTDKSVKYLCETILKKDQERPDEKTWGKMELDEKIAKAQASIEGYFPKLEGQIQMLFKHNEERTKKINELTEELEHVRKEEGQKRDEALRVKDDVIGQLKGKLDELTKKLRTGRMEDEGVQKIEDEISRITSPSQMEKPDIDMPLNGTVEVMSEEGDGLGEVVAEGVAAMYLDGEPVAPVTHGPKVALDRKAQGEAKKAVQGAAREKESRLGGLAGAMTDTQKLVIRAFGETGYSEAAQIVKYLTGKYPDIPSESRVTAALYDIVGHTETQGQFILKVDCHTPASPNLSLYKLSPLGRELYGYLFSKEPVMAEMDEIVKAHGSLEHGYGIKNVAALLEDSGFAKKNGAKISYMTRRKEYAVKVGQKGSYIPDIIAAYQKDGKEAKIYIEYETGACPDDDFMEKCNKIASFSGHIYIVVPNIDAKKRTIEKIGKWRERVMGGTYKISRPVRFQMATYNELKAGIAGERIPWQWEKKVAVPQQK